MPEIDVGTVNCFAHIYATLFGQQHPFQAGTATDKILVTSLLRCTGAAVSGVRPTGAYCLTVILAL